MHNKEVWPEGMLKFSTSSEGEGERQIPRFTFLNNFLQMVAEADW